MHPMTLDEIREALNARRDGQARAWGYDSSFSRFALRITSPSLAGNFHLHCEACSRVEFDMSWERPEIAIERVANGYMVRDGTHLYVACQVVAGHYNVPPLFDAGRQS
jgi:hypothetical protein